MIHRKLFQATVMLFVLQQVSLLPLMAEDNLLDTDFSQATRDKYVAEHTELPKNFSDAIKAGSVLPGMKSEEVKAALGKATISFGRKEKFAWWYYFGEVVSFRDDVAVEVKVQKPNLSGSWITVAN